MSLPAACWMNSKELFKDIAMGTASCSATTVKQTSTCRRTKCARCCTRTASRRAVVRQDRRGRPEGRVVEIVERPEQPIIGRLLHEGRHLDRCTGRQALRPGRPDSQGCNRSREGGVSGGRATHRATGSVRPARWPRERSAGRDRRPRHGDRGSPCASTACRPEFSAECLADGKAFAREGPPSFSPAVRGTIFSMRPVVVADDLRLGGFKIDRATLAALLEQRLVDVGRFSRSLTRSLRSAASGPRVVAEDGCHLGVREARMAEHHGRVELVGIHLAVGRDQHVAHHVQALDLGVERAAGRSTASRAASESRGAESTRLVARS